jgi:hypothetical protein
MTFTELDSTGILLFPLGMGESQRSGSSSGYGYKEMPYNTYWNILFVNSKTSEQHLLADRKMLIRSYGNSVTGSDRDHSSDKYIFYTVTAEDANADSVFTEKDPEYLFVSDSAGYQFRQVSPGGYDLREWKYIKSSGKIFLIAAKDSDGNKEYDEDDELAAFEVDIMTNAAPVEVFSPALKTQLREMYDKYWKRIKK